MCLISIFNKRFFFVSDKAYSSLSDESKNSSLIGQEIPANLPKKTQELYMRIQQQQREAQDSYKNLEDNEEQEISQENWYSDDDNDDDDDDDDQLTIVLKDIQKEEEDEDEKEEKQESMEQDLTLQPASIPQPAAIVDKLGDLSKIDISMEVSKLLSTIKAQSSSSSQKQDKDSATKIKKDSNLPSGQTETKPSVPEIMSQFSKTDNSGNSPSMSPTSLLG